MAAADEVEQELPCGLSERQMTEFVENDEVHSSALIGMRRACSLLRREPRTRQGCLRRARRHARN